MLAETYWQLVRDPAHWVFELTVEAVTAVFAFIYGAFWVKRHDRKKHGKGDH
jgi:hypothetical protein